MNTQPESASWQTLYRVGAWAAIIAVFFIFRRNMSAEISLLSGQMPPVVAGDWFALLQRDRLLGLAFLNVFDIVNYALVGLLLLALYAALHRVNPSIMTIAVCLGIIGVGVYFASNQAFAMLSLSERYVATLTDEQRTALLSAGEGLLALEQGTGILMSLFSVTLAGLLTSIVMLRSDLFSRVTAWLGIVAHILVLCYFPVLIFAPSLTFVPHSAAAVPLIAWQFLAARRLLQLASR